MSNAKNVFLAEEKINSEHHFCHGSSEQSDELGRRDVALAENRVMRKGAKCHLVKQTRIWSVVS